MKKSGFTLSEMLIALVIIGVVSAITAPVLRGLMPNQNKIMIKRAYNITTNVVKNMIDNTELYSPFSGDSTEMVYKGFDNTESVTYNGKTYSGASKFGDLFLNSIGATDISTDTCQIDFQSKYTTESSSYTCSYGFTKNGVKWYVMNPSLSDVAAFIMIDVNSDKKPNCTQSDDACKSKTNGFDRFVVEVMNNGEVLFNTKDSWAKETIDLQSAVNSKE